VFLVGAEFAAESVGRLAGLDAFEAVEAVAEAAEGLVGGGEVLVRFEQGVEQGGLAGGEAEGGAAGFGGGEEEALAAKPVLGEEADGAVAERDVALAGLEGLEEFGEADAAAVEVHPAFQIEPVDAGLDGEAEAAGGAEAALGGLDAAADGGEGADGVGEASRGDLAADAEGGEGFAGAAFAGGIAFEDAAGGEVEEAGGPAVVVEDPGAVLEVEGGGETFALGADAEDGDEGGAVDGEAGLGGRGEGEGAGDVEGALEEIAGIGGGEVGGFAEELEPGEVGVEVEGGEGAAGDEEAAVEE
jgi:hypothetical protein